MVFCGGKGKGGRADPQFGRRDTTEYVSHEELGTLLEPIRQDIHNLSLELRVLKEDVYQLSLEVGVLKEDVHQLRKGNVHIKIHLAGLVLGQSHAVPPHRDADDP